MKILLYAPGYDKPTGDGAHGHRNMRDGLLQLGAEIIDFDFKEMNKRHGIDRANQLLKDIIDTEKPDLFYHGIVEEELLPEVAEYIKDGTSTTSLLFLSDDEWRLGHSLQHASRYNFIVTNHSPAVDVYHHYGHRHVIHCQWACNPKYFHPVSTPKEYDVSFVGLAYQGRFEPVLKLKESGINIKVWGQSWENCPQLRDIAHGSVPHFEMLRIISASKIVLSLNRSSLSTDIPQIKGRIFENGACRAFQLCYENPLLLDYYRSGSEMIYCNDDNLVDLTKYYLQHDREREDIAQRCYERTLRDHTWEKRFTHLLDTVLSDKPADKKSFHYSLPKHPLRVNPRYDRKLSVICYFYNQEKYIEDLLESARQQTYKDFEFSLLDDGSTDGSYLKIKPYLSDPRFKYHNQDNVGKDLQNFDKLISKSLSLVNSELVAFIGGDDVMHPERLGKQVESFEADPSIDINFTNVQCINENNQLIDRYAWDKGELSYGLHFSEKRSTLPRKFFRQNIIFHPSIMMKRLSIDHMGGFETGYASDYDFWLRSCKYLKYNFIDEKLLYYRIHRKNASGFKDVMNSETSKVRNRCRKNYTVLDLYPEITECVDINNALYCAYILESCFWMENDPSDLSRVKRYLKFSLEHYPYGPEAFCNLGILFLLEGNIETASKFYRKAEELVDLSSMNYDHKQDILYQINIFLTYRSGRLKGCHLKVKFVQPCLESELMRSIERSGGLQFFTDDKNLATI